MTHAYVIASLLLLLLQLSVRSRDTGMLTLRPKFASSVTCNIIQKLDEEILSRCNNVLAVSKDVIVYKQKVRN